MRHIIAIAVVFAIGFVAHPQADAAEPVSSRAYAVTEELPAALAALNPQPSDFTTRSEAEEVRGEWLLNLRLALGHIHFHGHDKFELSVHTIGVGHTSHYGKPVKIWLQIGY